MIPQIKSGFTVEGESEEAAFVNGKWVDVTVMDILKGEEGVRKNHSGG